MQGKGREGLLQMELLCVCKRVCRVSLGGGGGIRAVRQAGWFRVSGGGRRAPWVPGTHDLHQPGWQHAGLSLLVQLQGCHSQTFPFQQMKPCSWIASPPSRMPSHGFGTTGALKM